MRRARIVDSRAKALKFLNLAAKSAFHGKGARESGPNALSALQNRRFRCKSAPFQAGRDEGAETETAGPATADRRFGNFFL